MLKILLQSCRRQKIIFTTISNNSHSFSSIKSRPFFKKKDYAKIKINPIANKQSEDNQVHTIEQKKWKFVEQLKDPHSYLPFFHEYRGQLPLFLRKITKILNNQYYLKNIKSLHDIYYRINKQSSELVLSAQQFIQIMLFVERYQYFQLLNSKEPFQSARNGFQHRSSIIANTLLEKRQLNLTQSILIFHILCKIGTICINFLTTFTKFIKIELQENQNQQQIQIEHILIIMNRYYYKQNRTVIENILFDQTLNYLIKNTRMTKDISQTNRIQLVFGLLSINLKYCYLSNEQQRDQLLFNLLKSMNESIPDSYQTLQKKQREYKICRLPTITLLLEFWDKYLPTIKSSSIQRIMIDISQKLSRLSYQIISKLHHQKKQQQQSSIIYRLVFSRQFLKQTDQNNRKAIIKKLSDKLAYRLSNYSPLVDRYYEGEGENRKYVIQTIKFVYNQLLAKEIFNPALAKIMIEVTSSKHIEATINNMIPFLTKQTQNQQEIMTMYALIIAIKQSGTIEYFPPELFLKLQEINKKIIDLSKNSIPFMKSMTNLLQIYRDNQFYRTWLLQLIRVDENIMNHHLNITNQFERHRVITSYNYILFLLETMNVQLKSLETKVSLNHTFNQIYQILLNLYPKNNPNIKSYHSSYSILDNQQHFIANFSAVQAYSKGKEKYYYHLWDIFMIFYVKRSQSAKRKLFPTLKRIFKQVFDKQQIRKVVIFSYMTNYISDGEIVTSRQQLKELFEQGIEQLTQVSYTEKFHYSCFTRIAFNALAAGLLTTEICRRIARRMINSKSFTAGNNSILKMLLASFLRNQTEEMFQSLLQQTKTKLSHFQVARQITFSSTFELEMGQELRKTYRANYRFICILLMFSQPQLSKLRTPILQFVKQCEGYKDLAIMIESFDPVIYKSRDRQMQQFAKELNNIFSQKHQFLKSKQLISTSRSQQFEVKIENNRKILNDIIL